MPKGLIGKGIVIQKPFFCLLWVLFCLCFAVGIGEVHAVENESHSSDSPRKLLITGSSTMCPLIAEIGKLFHSLHPEIIVDVQCGGSGRGISDVREGKADIGMASRTLNDKEQDLYGFPIARDGLSIILHKNNPVKSLSDQQVADIYTGKITNWEKVDGRDAPITVINPGKGYSSAELFTHYFGLSYDDIKATVVAGDNPTRTRAVVDNPDAIAYISAGEAERTARAGVPIKPLPFNNVLPTNRNIITGNYPITRPLTLITKGLPAGPAKTFIDYCLSSAVVDLITKYDFVPYED
jgi:phosphate transport system substrate-binding protein